MRRDLSTGIPLNHPLIREIFDVVFLDPPYRSRVLPFLLGDLSTKGVVSSGSFAVVESSKDEKPPVSVVYFHMVDTRSYGDTRISVFEYEAKK